MAQWDVYANPSPRSRDDLPYLVDVQSKLLAGLSTRFVVPLAPQGPQPSGLPPRMVPVFEIERRAVRLVPHQAGAIDATALRRPVASLRQESHRIVEALDAVVTGV